MNLKTNTKAKLFNDEDVMHIFHWRNSDEIRQQMFNKEVIALSEHREWCRKIIADDNRLALVIWEDDSRIGFVQFQNILNSQKLIWGFYKDPLAVKGAGRKVASTAINYVEDNYHFKHLWGHVIASNVVSIHFHLALGFELKNIVTKSDENILNKEAILRFRLTRETWKKNAQ